MDIIGRTIANRYEIISKTGVGGMATVYVARDKVLNRDVAVKVLKDEFTTEQTRNENCYNDNDAPHARYTYLVHPERIDAGITLCFRNLFPFQQVDKTISPDA